MANTENVKSNGRNMLTLQQCAMLKERKVFVFDMDGTLSLGPNLFKHTAPLFKALKKAKKHIYVGTNNSSKTPDEFKNRIIANGLDGGSFETLTSLDAALCFLKQQGIKKAYWAATPSVDEYIKQNGVCFCAENPDAVLLTYDTSLSYEKLENLVRLLSRGLPYYATHPDMLCPTEHGYPLPDVGCFMDMLFCACGRRPAKIFGKPSTDILQPVFARGFKLEDIVMVGDRLYTDIALGHNNAILTVLVYSGETTLQDYAASEIKADIVLDNIGGLLNIFEE